MSSDCSDWVEIFKTLPGLIAAFTALVSTLLFAWSERLGDDKNPDPSGNVSGVLRRWASNGVLSVIKGILGVWVRSRTNREVEPVAVVVKPIVEDPPKKES